MRFSYGTVRESQRRVVYAVRVEETLLDLLGLEDVAEQMRKKLAARGEHAPDVVVTQGDTKETFRIYGNSFSVTLVRTAMFNAAVSWSRLELDME